MPSGLRRPSAGCWSAAARGAGRGRPLELGPSPPGPCRPDHPRSRGERCRQALGPRRPGALGLRPRGHPGPHPDPTGRPCRVPRPRAPSRTSQGFLRQGVPPIVGGARATDREADREIFPPRGRLARRFARFHLDGSSDDRPVRPRTGRPPEALRRSPPQREAIARCPLLSPVVSPWSPEGAPALVPRVRRPSRRRRRRFESARRDRAFGQARGGDTRRCRGGSRCRARIRRDPRQARRPSRGGGAACRPSRDS